MTDATINIAVYDPNANTRRRWIEELTKHLPANTHFSEQADADTDYAVVWLPPDDFFDNAVNLKACLSMGAGVDRLMTHPRLPETMPVYRLQDAGMGIQMARYCRHEVEHYRLYHYRYEQQQRNRQWDKHTPLAPADMPVGLLGFGVLGQQVADALLHEGHPVSAFRRSPGVAQGNVKIYGGADQWSDFLAASQVLVVIAPLTDDTRGIINATALAALPEGAWLVNVGRGGLIDNDALLDALASGHLSGATLDVFDTEPLPSNSPLWQAPGIRITPHISAITLVPESATQVASTIRALESGRKPGGLVDRGRGY